MAAACVLADTAPNDFHRRVLARPVLVYCHEFIRWARRAKNELRPRQDRHDTVRKVEEDLNDLERRDWGDYEQIRHRIAAHRQTIDPDLVTSITTGNEMWSDLSDDALRILSEDARAIWNLPVVPRASRRSIASRRLQPSYRPRSTIAVTSRSRRAACRGRLVRRHPSRRRRGHARRDIGEQNRQIVDAVRNVRTLSQLWLAVNGYEPFWRIVLGATVTEACTLVDLLFGTGKPLQGHQQPSLLELLEQDRPISPAVPVLRAARSVLDPAALAHVRDLRNRAGAHIDDRLAVREISQRLQTFRPRHAQRCAGRLL